MFGNIKLDSEGPINRHNNFQNFPQALMLLFRCATGENWQEIMRGCLAGVECEPKKSGSSHDSKKCGLDFAYTYFCSFIFLSTFLVSRFKQFFYALTKLFQVCWMLYEDAEFVCGGDNGQLWLFDKGFVHFGRSPSWRVHKNLGRHWPIWNVCLTLNIILFK